MQCRLAGSRPAAGAGAAAVTTDQKGPQAVRPKARMPSIVLPLSEETFGPLRQTLHFLACPGPEWTPDILAKVKGAWSEQA